MVFIIQKKWGDGNLQDHKCTENVRLRKILPDINVVYTSGSANTYFVKDGILESSVSFLEKPCSAPSLSGIIRQILDGVQPGSCCAWPEKSFSLEYAGLTT